MTGREGLDIAMLEWDSARRKTNTVVSQYDTTSRQREYAP